MKHRIRIAAATICVATFLGFDSYHRAHTFTGPDQDWQNWSDQSFAPPGWDCIYQHQLDLGDCEPQPGWVLVNDPLTKFDILVRPGKWERQIDTDTARAWNDLNPGEQYAIRVGQANIYQFVVFNKSGSEDTWQRRKPAAQPRSETNF
jgi:hypothetical protein